uniref:Uncharacterized protein n=1 Tax=Schistosoma mansoni TaxID=6183 RepID=A0A5K4EC24_SCHMA
MAHYCIHNFFLLLCILIQKELKCSKIIENIEDSAKFYEVRLPELDKEAQIAEDEAQKVINEIIDQQGNHNVSFGKLIECQKLYYESEQGITLLTGIFFIKSYVKFC